MKMLMSVIIWAGCVVLTIVLFLAIFLVTVLFFSFDRKRKLAHAQGYWWSSALIGLNPFWKLRISGLENIDAKKTYVIVVNHQSLADIVVLYKLHMQFKWVAKESLFKLPFIGWSLFLARHIRLSRGKFASIKESYRQAAEWLRSDISVLFFPEGTRSETEEMNKFQNGAFKLAIQEKKPILPISITGTREVLPKGNWVFNRKVFCRLKVLPSIETTQFQPAGFSRLRDLVRAQLAAA